MNCGNEIIMAGGYFPDDKTCSIDSYKINAQSGELADMNACLKAARMHHSMIMVEEKGIILAVGGEDENGNLLDSCESYNFQDNQWKMLNSLNNKGKNIGLCKFIKTPNNRQ